ncbi:MAG: glycoside hydrolase [Candidatus Rokubacteria bacterium]|nr:glycoside hydrolase [Candidatus Rokubacteria bacterium]
MPGPLSVILLWHLHQPLYKDLVSGAYRLPWARLHGVGAYTTMAMVAAELPELPVTFNLVPSLLLQIEDYASGSGSDPWLELALKPAEELTPDEGRRLVRSFFLARPETMIFPHPRYRQLWQLRDSALRDATEARWPQSQLRDLQVWFHLAWTSPLIRAQHPVARALVAKGEGFSEADKLALLTLHRELLGGLAARYRDLQDRGCAELSTSPFYHPILPLLCDLAVAREADPTAPPAEAFAHPEDAREQIVRAIAFHADRFGRTPEGLWPSEGSVSEAVLRLTEESGLRWIATDEVLLWRSLERSGQPAPGWLCPAVWEGAPQVAVFFRQHDLSDRIGFRYSRLPTEAAVGDLLGALHAIRNGLPARAEDAVVMVALDGENAWESYPEQGVPFLRALYRALTTDPNLRLVTPRQRCAQRPPGLRLHRLHPGSWIDGTFRIWAGHAEDLAAWRLVSRARAALTCTSPSAQPDQLETAWQALFAAEGSDWNWWYGTDHTSGMDDVFDVLFRGHVATVYVKLGLDVPPDVLTPIASGSREQLFHLPPVASLDPCLDGRVTNFFEWQNAGMFVPRQGALEAAVAPITRLFYGFSLEGLCLRLDPDPRSWPLAEGRLTVECPERPDAVWSVSLDPGSRDVETGAGRIRVSVGAIAELLIPTDLRAHAEAGQAPIVLTVSAGESAIQRIPAAGWLWLRRPSELEEAAW